MEVVNRIEVFTQVGIAGRATNPVMCLSENRQPSEQKTAKYLFHYCYILFRHFCHLIAFISHLLIILHCEAFMVNQINYRPNKAKSDGK